MIARPLIQSPLVANLPLWVKRNQAEVIVNDVRPIKDSLNALFSCEKWCPALVAREKEVRNVACVKAKEHCAQDALVALVKEQVAKSVFAAVAKVAANDGYAKRNWCPALVVTGEMQAAQDKSKTQNQHQRLFRQYLRLIQRNLQNLQPLNWQNAHLL